MQEKARGFLIAGLIGCCVFGSSLAADMVYLFKGDKNIWWTNKNMMLPLAKAKDTVEIYINGRHLAGLVEEGALFVRDRAGQAYRVVDRDIGFRVNNWNDRKASLLQKAVVGAFGFGLGLSLLIAGLYLKLSQKNPPSQSP